MATVLNLTPHDVNIMGAKGELLVTFPKSGMMARVAQSDKVVDTIIVDGISIDVYAPSYGAVQDLPEPVEGTIYLVSLKVKEAAPDRLDLRVPYGAVRDAEGRIVGCKGLA